VEDPELEAVFEDHLSETREHGELVQSRLTALGGDSSSVKDAAMRLGALNWGAFFQGHPDTPGKLVAFAYAFEHLEIGGYEQLKRVADAAGDSATVDVVETILREERTAARLLARAFDAAAADSLRAVGVSG
jgi:ferritin-like metal-binding protein YciE